MCHCGVVVKELLARADKPGSTPGEAVFCFLYRFSFPVWSLFSTLFFLLAFFSLFLLLTLLVMHLDQYQYVLSLKGFQKLRVDLQTGQAYDLIKTIRPVKTCPSSETAEFFSMLVDIMTNNTQYTTNCTNLHPTPTSDPLAKVKLAFCTSSYSSIIYRGLKARLPLINLYFKSNNKLVFHNSVNFRAHSCDFSGKG